MNMETDRKPRKLDVAESASIDIISLNNKVVKMRPIVKKATYQTVQKMVRSIQALKKKKGTEEQLEQNKRKINRLIEDIQAIKTLRANKVSKFALSNTLTFDQICKKPDACAETRGLARVAKHKAMQAEVVKFREEHSDWKSLTEFLLSHVARRFYKNKYKGPKFKMVSNTKVGNQLIKSYIESKVTETGKTNEDDVDEGKDDDNDDGRDNDNDDDDENGDEDDNDDGNDNDEDDDNDGNDNDEDDDNDDGNDNDKDDDSDVDHERLTVKKERMTDKLVAKNVKTVPTLSKEKNLDCEVNFSKHTDDSDDNDLNEHNLDLDIENKDSDDNSEYDEKDDDNSDDDDDDSNLDEESDIVDHVESEESENESDIKRSREMVVKKLNMEDLKNSKDVHVPDFLISHSVEENSRQNKKTKDSFFMSEHGEDENSDNDKSHFNNSDSESEESDNDQFVSKRNAMKSSFIGSLNEEKSKYRDFDEMDRRGRGRGQFNRFSQNRGGFQNYEREGRGGFQNYERGGRGRFQNYEKGGRGGFQNYERGGRGGFQNFERRGRGGFQNYERGGRGRFQNYERGGRGGFQKFEGRGRGNPRFFDNQKFQSGIQRPSKEYMKTSAGSKDLSKTPEKIHPSWEASKKRKEHATIQAFQGKKIKFDD